MEHAAIKMGSNPSDPDISIFQNYGKIVNRLSYFSFIPFKWDTNNLEIVTKPPSRLFALAKNFSVVSFMIFLNFRLCGILLNGKIPVLSKLLLTARTLNVTTIFFSYHVMFQNPQHLPNIVNNLVKLYFKWKRKFHMVFQH